MAKLDFVFAPGMDCGVETKALVFRPLPDQGFVSIQVSRGVAGALERLRMAVGELPEAVGAITRTVPAIAATGPLAFLALTDRDDARGLAVSINAQSDSETAFHAVDVSHRGATFRLEGPASIEALARTVEIDPASIAPGGCARTIWNRNSILVIRDAPASWRVTVDIGFGWALADWMKKQSEGTLDQ